MNRIWTFALAGLLVSLILATLISPFASSSPDGLEKVALDKRFLVRSEGKTVWKLSLIADYLMPGIKNEAFATGLAGLAGTLLVFGTALGIGRLISKRSRKSS